MVYKINLEDLPPDICERSFRYLVKNEEGQTLRDTYFLVNPDTSPSQSLKMGHTVIYPNGKTTGHFHPELEEVYFVLCGRGEMVIGDEKFPIKEGDAFYVPPGSFHVTYNNGLLPLRILWVTAKISSNKDK